MRWRWLVALPEPEDCNPGAGCALAVIFSLAMWAGIILTVALGLGWRP